MDDATRQLTRRLATVCGLDSEVAARVVAEVLDAFATTVDDFIARRHDELQAQGWPNESIYRQIRSELASQRFRAPDLSDRQIRRRIYG